MTAPESDSPTVLRQRLEQEADAVRERLISGVDELTERTHRVEALVETVTDYTKRHKAPLIAAGVAITVLSTWAYFKHRATAKRRARLRLVSHVAMQLFGVQPPPPREPGIVRKSLGTLGMMVATAAAKNVQQRVLQGMGVPEPQDHMR
jgi:hypothetical protein